MTTLYNFILYVSDKNYAPDNMFYAIFTREQVLKRILNKCIYFFIDFSTFHLVQLVPLRVTISNRLEQLSRW